ncbi:MAG: hypothetical protein BRD43_02750 [Bacteroidetes bacterium QS_4_64_154]|nr:MAG: hypothetical protein BRD43_02750 [Bacteroidetes bacterium QS_4_64_154]
MLLSEGCRHHEYEQPYADEESPHSRQCHEWTRHESMVIGRNEDSKFPDVIFSDPNVSREGTESNETLQQPWI